MTGLYENIYDLQNEKSLTFLYRAPKIILEPLNYTAIKSHYMRIFDINDEMADKMTLLTRGFHLRFRCLDIFTGIIEKIIHLKILCQSMISI